MNRFYCGVYWSEIKANDWVATRTRACNAFSDSSTNRCCLIFGSTGDSVYLSSLSKKTWGCAFLPSLKEMQLALVFLILPLPPRHSTVSFHKCNGRTSCPFLWCWKEVFSKPLFSHPCNSHSLLSHMPLLKLLIQAGFSGSWPTLSWSTYL